MSVVVLGMEMPIGCYDCLLSTRYGCKATMKMFNTLANVAVRSKDCPLRPLPEKHGSLIDRNAMFVEAQRIAGPITGDGWDNWAVYGLIDRQPTIIEAEGESDE